MRFKSMIVTTLAVLGLSSTVWAATYNVDVDHTAVTFKVRHLFSQTQGNFKKFEGVIEYEPGKPETWSTSGTIQVESIDTNVPERDKHLKSPDFFDVAKFPAITFKSTGVENATETSAKLKGEMTMHGVTKPIVLDVQINGAGSDPWGNMRAGFTATTKINRKDFDIAWNQTLDKGALMLGEEVQITLEIEALNKKA